MRYYVNIGGTEEVVDVEAVDATRYRVASVGPDDQLQGPPTTVMLRDAGAALITQVGEGRQYVSAGSTPGQFDVTAGPNRTQASVVSGRQRTLERLGRARHQRGGAASIKAPMPGRVVRILTQEGQTVEAGQALIAIEAMKMENELLSERAGVVQRIFVKAGDSVEGGAELLRLTEQTQP